MLSFIASRGILFPKAVSWLGLFLSFLTANRLKYLRTGYDGMHTVNGFEILVVVDELSLFFLGNFMTL